MFASACSSRARSAVERRGRRRRLGAQRALLGARPRREAVRDALEQRRARRARRGRTGSRPWSERAITSRSSASWLRRSVSSAAERTASSSSVAACCAPRSASSSSVRRIASGVRSSWLASETNERSRASTACRRAEHRVERVAEAGDLVARRRHRQPALRLAGQLARRAGASARPAAARRRRPRSRPARPRAARAGRRSPAACAGPRARVGAARATRRRRRRPRRCAGRRRAAEHADAVLGARRAAGARSRRRRPRPRRSCARREQRRVAGARASCRAARPFGSSTCASASPEPLRRPDRGARAHERGGVAGARLEPVVDRAVEVARRSAATASRSPPASSTAITPVNASASLIRSGARAHQELMADMVARAR